MSSALWMRDGSRVSSAGWPRRRGGVLPLELILQRTEAAAGDRIERWCRFRLPAVQKGSNGDGECTREIRQLVQLWEIAYHAAFNSRHRQLINTHHPPPITRHAPRATHHSLATLSILSLPTGYFCLPAPYPPQEFDENLSNLPYMGGGGGGKSGRWWGHRWRRWWQVVTGGGRWWYVVAGGGRYGR